MVTLNALALSAVLLIFFWFLGSALLALLHTQRDLVRNFLIAPAAGVLTSLYCTYVLSRLGLPVRSFAVPLAAVLFLAALTILAWRRPLFPARQVAPFIIVAFVALIATGWPLLTNGFAWLAKANPDFTLYVLDAHRLADQGFLDSPVPSTWTAQTDWPSLLVVFPALGQRTGTDLLLAWVVSVTGRNGLEIYMPVMVALQVILVAAASALISTPYRLARLLAGTLMSVAAMMTLGLALQLIAQVLGLIATVLACVLCLSPFYRLGRSLFLRFVVLASVVMAAYVLIYPEMLPIFALSFLVYHLGNPRDLRRFGLKELAGILAIAALSAVLIAPDAIGSLLFLFHQFGAAVTRMRYPEIFPYFLIPSGVSALWGLTPYVPHETTLLAIAVVIGGALTVFTAISAVWLLFRGEAMAAVLIVMIGLMLFLFLNGSAFGVFKLAMYMQPFMLTCFVLAVCRLTRIAR